MTSLLSKTSQAGFAVVMIIALGGCSDSPKQYANETPAVAKRPVITDQEKLGDGGDTDKPAPGGTAIDDDQLTRQNAREPMIYGVGAGGITFETDFKASQGKLSKPDYGPDADGLAAYKSGMYIWWRDTEPRVPTQILILSDYLGELKVGGEFGSWKMGEDLSKHFAQDAKGEKFLVAAYNQLEGKDGSFSCLTKRICQVTGWDDPNSPNIVMETPKLILLISKDRKVLFRLLLLNQEPKGKLHNDLDITRGEILVPAEEDQPATRIQLGQSWEEILKINGENAKTQTSRDMMGKMYDGVFVALTKSDFSRTYNKEPKANETLKGLTVFGNWRNHLRVDGKLVEMSIAGDDSVDLTLVTGEAAEGKDYLQLKPDIAPGRQVGFLRKLLALLETELGKSGAKTISQLTGLHKAHGAKTYSAAAIGFDEKTGKGRVIGMALSEESRGFNYMEVSDVAGAADKRIIPALLKATNAGDKSLAGFTLGDTLKLPETDIGRGEATVSLPGGGSERASYVQKDFLRVSYDGERVVPETQSGVAMGAVGVRLGLVPGKAASEYRVTSISTGGATISNICGIQGLDAVPGMEDEAFLSQLTAAVSKAKQADKNLNCRYLMVNDADDTGRVAAIYFADQKLKLGFGERELNQVTIYVNPREVK